MGWLIQHFSFYFYVRTLPTSIVHALLYTHFFIFYCVDDSGVYSVRAHRPVRLDLDTITIVQEQKEM